MQQIVLMVQALRLESRIRVCAASSWDVLHQSWECVHISKGHVAMVQARVTGTFICMVSCHAVAGCMREECKIAYSVTVPPQLG